MNTLHSLSKVIYVPATKMVRKKSGFIFFMLFSIFSFSTSFSQGLIFQNPKLESGKAGADKAVYRFPNVKTGYDALVTIKGRSDKNVMLLNIDVTSSGYMKAFQPQVTYNSNNTAPGRAKWHMDFDVVLVAAGTKTRTAVSEIDVTGLDIDGNGDKIREFVIYTNPISVLTETISSLTTDELPVIDFNAENGDPVLCRSCNKSSVLVLCANCNGSGLIATVANGVAQTSNCANCAGSGKLYSGCSHAYNPKANVGSSYEFIGPTRNFASIDTFATQVMVTATWLNTDQVTFRIGGENLSSGSQGAADRLYSLWFKSFRYIGAAFLPVSLTDWKANVVKNNVQLSWTSFHEKDIDHYTIERSHDGVNFHQVGSLIAEGDNDNKKNYTYTDKISPDPGTIYYRLKTIDLTGKNHYSEVRVVRIASASHSVSVVAYPNPVVDELKITVPAKWQGKAISFEIYNINGLAVKRISNNASGITQSVNVHDLSPGLYIVKVKSGLESATAHIVKSK
jgi:hypothetical protein